MGIVPIGRLDGFLYPFYKKGIQNGTLTKTKHGSSWSVSGLSPILGGSSVVGRPITAGITSSLGN